MRGQLVGDLHDFLSGQLPPEKGEQRKIIVLGDAFG
jgi:hypothetical protein